MTIVRTSVPVAKTTVPLYPHKEYSMAEQRDDAPYQPYADEVIHLLNAHIARRPDPTKLEAAWRMGLATLLAEIVRGYKMFPEDRDAYLDRVCAGLREGTEELLRRGDASGWRLP
jgi:hypothetical protein